MIIGSLLLAVLVALIIQSVDIARVIVWLSGLAVLVMFGVLMARGGRAERSGLLATLLLTLQGMLFFVFYQQSSTSLTLFALHDVRLNFLGYRVPPEQFQVLNPFWIAVFSPLLALVYGALAGEGRSQRGREVRLGLCAAGAGLFVYGISGRYAVDGLVSPWWMVWAYLLQSVGELLISGLGPPWCRATIAPARRGLMIGAWYLGAGIAQYIGSYVANFAAAPSGAVRPAESLALYEHLFIVLGWVGAAGTVVALVMLPLMHRLERSTWLARRVRPWR